MPSLKRDTLLADQSEGCSENAYVALNFDECCSILEEAIIKHPLHREIHYKTLHFCRDIRTLEELEKEIAHFAEYKYATQNPYHLICVLEDAGGLVRLDFDREGNPVTREQRSGLTEAEIEDLIASSSFETSDIGREMVSRHAPQARLRELLEVNPAYKNTYLELLEFCSGEPRSYSDIEDLLKGSEALVREYNDYKQTMQASVFVDDLERAGGIVWNEAWLLTKEGMELLEEVKTSEN